MFERNDNPIGIITAGVVAIVGGFLAMFPDFPLVTNSLVPPGNPQPGTPGGN